MIRCRRNIGIVVFINSEIFFLVLTHLQNSSASRSWLKSVMKTKNAQERLKSTGGQHFVNLGLLKLILDKYDLQTPTGSYPTKANTFCDQGGS